MRFADNFRDEYGRALVGAKAYVYKPDGSLETALTADGGASLSNPVIADQFGNIVINAPLPQYTLDLFFAGRRVWKEQIGDPAPGPEGDPGLSAYEVAVANGFVGTQAQWLASLVGTGGGAVDPTLLAAYTFTSASGVAFAAGVVSIDTIGYSTPGDGGAASYIYDAAVDAAYVTAHPAVSFMASGGRGFRLDTKQRWNAEMFGFKGDYPVGSAFGAPATGIYTDNLSPFNAYVAYGSYFFNGDGTPLHNHYVLPVLHFGAAGYYFSAPPQPYWAVHLKGVGAEGSGGINGTLFKFPANSGGMVLNAGNTGDGGVISAFTRGPGAGGSIIEGIYFMGSGGTGVNAHGMWARTKFKMWDCVFDSFPACGIAVIAASGAGGAIEGNASNSYIARCTMRANRGFASFYAAGADSNGSTFDTIQVKDGYGIGILDTSQFGNCHINPQVNGSGEVQSVGNTIANLGRVSYNGGYWKLTTPTSLNQVPGSDPTVWHYEGSDGGAPNLTYWTTWSASITYVSGSGIILGPGACTRIGGYTESLTEAITGDAVAIGGTFSPFENQNNLLPWQAEKGLFNGGALGVRKYFKEASDVAGYGSDAKVSIGYKTGLGANSFTILRHYDAKDGKTWSFFRYSDGDYYYSDAPPGMGSHVYRITGANSALTFGRGAAVPRAFLPYKLALGDPESMDPANARIIGYTNTLPSSGVGAVGDRRWNYNPTVLGVGEWVKTTTGWIAKSTAVGYATGTGGAVTQGSGSGKSTTLTINNLCGQITMDGSALAAGAVASFVMFNSTIADGDVVIVNINSGSATRGTYLIGISQVDPGNCVIDVRNMSGGSLSEALVLNFAVIKAVAA